MSRKVSVRVMASYATVPLDGEWLEAFWCEECQQREWYWVTRSVAGDYSLCKVPDDLWQQAQGVILAEGNPTVSEFTRRQSRHTSYKSTKDFTVMGS